MDILSTVLVLIPVGVVLGLANLAFRNRIEGQANTERTLKWVSYGLLAALYAALIFGGFMLQGLGLLAQSPWGQNLAEALQAGGLNADALVRAGLGLWAPSLLGIGLLARPARRLAARYLRLDADNPVHGVALSLSALVLVNLLSTLGLGLKNLAAILERQGTQGSSATLVPAFWAQNISFALLALVGVGWLARRTIKGSLNRLGIVRPELWQVGLGLAVGLPLVPLVLGLELLVSQLGLGADPDVERLTEQLVGPLMTSAPGILTLGLAAALGEESIFRGALLPRFGLVLSTVLFALLHSQYGVSFSTLIVLLIGLILGALRQRYNTTTAMVTHATYNMALGLIAYLGLF